MRVNAEQGQSNTGLLVSAYKSTDGQLVMLYINPDTDSQTITATPSSGQLANPIIYTTSATADLTRSAVARPDDSRQMHCHAGKQHDQITMFNKGW